MKKAQSHLPALNRTLGQWQASAIVVGSIIGTGIFLKAATMTQLMGSLGLVSLVWIIAGLLSYAGALTYAELSSAYPESGGEYALLKHGWGRLPGFLYGWMRFWIASPGSIAAYAVGAATFSKSIFKSLGPDHDYSTVLALSLIAFFTLLNCLQLKWGARTQTALTFLKVLIIIGLSLGIFIFGEHHTEIAIANLQTPTWSLSNFGLAMIAALWAYDGWNNLPMVGAEIKEPQKNIPRALGWGVFICILLYVFANYSYFYVLTPEQIQSANSRLHPEALPVATLAAQSFLGDVGIPVLTIAFIISAVGAMNGSILTGARVPYAMAKDGLFWKRLGQVESHSHVPVWAVLTQGAWAMILASSGTFDQLTDYVVVASWLFYAITAATIFKLRDHSGVAAGAFKIKGYPYVPIAFILVSLGLTANSLWRNPTEGLIGAGLIGLGLPVYYFLNKK
ncbi:MAG: amino acid transporter [Oligoflexia bacterium]|nr:MAG: amino acid transporter [Oligoflexia bacterium]